MAEDEVKVMSMAKYHRQFLMQRTGRGSLEDALPDAWMRVESDGRPIGSLRIALRDDIAPRTCQNFRALCTGSRGTGRLIGKPLSYKGCPLHKVVRGFIVQGGDIEFGDGRGGQCVFDNRTGCFDDESFAVRHSDTGIVSMANSGVNTNRSQFFITLAPAPHLDGRNVAFGKVVDGLETLRAEPRPLGRPRPAPAALWSGWRSTARRCRRSQS
eukprot:TRINITY_DN16497_c0_g1_i2.p1 TRINITY_DN16497_c0_g1~~TRINITY_DN16497_c0_g1_i2.p1  ORF type:complete len:231 (+),score=47.49 TRINITY_DN16497_c0_g1_i2:57-695(+)